MLTQLRRRLGKAGASITRRKKEEALKPAKKEPELVLPTSKLGIYNPIVIGSDPEFFFKKGNKIIGAELVIPKNGVHLGGSSYKIIIDGVQGEMNPPPASCRQTGATYIGTMLHEANKLAKAKRARLCFNTTVKISKSELKKLDPKNQVFGCDPSFNAYGDHVPLPNPQKYFYRSAGGHIHIGRSPGLEKAFYSENAERTVKVLDIIVGNTLVMVDRDKGNIERRKVYGRAGEYRLPPHGIEYRVLSNFWIKRRELVWLAYGLVRQAINIAANDNITEALLASVDEEDIRNAINNNDLALARKNWERIKPILIEITKTRSEHEYVISAKSIDVFEKFMEKGIKHWFKAGPLTGWGRSVAYPGFESFLERVVKKDKA